MDITFTTANLGNALMLMLLGMIGIFVVLGVVMGAVFLLNKFAKDSPKDGDNDNGRS